MDLIEEFTEFSGRMKALPHGLVKEPLLACRAAPTVL